ncbi:hypothetical protein [Alkalicoccobacillus murimartini]|uniref:TM2 domain-containing membrane protein YozV n=1 Tax=Alkalicoccobacillus murimartini TaxID=171685 RepID=A0ABT9YM54_9BACI|nr:hypothetical protein [Alkalicoccobacillus murimartini]MDQ0208937.1 TM2 domain-containing membrane protein YozV [Alkalicoccobacillus murimartini]
MLVIFILLFIVCFATMGIVRFLATQIIKNEKRALYFEIVGYIILAVSFGWNVVVHFTNEMSSGTDLYIINEKLNQMWYYNQNLVLAMDNNDFTKFHDYSHNAKKQWIYIEESTMLFREQEKIVGYISLGLLYLSGMLIACGRGHELLAKFFNLKKRH